MVINLLLSTKQMYIISSHSLSINIWKIRTACFWKVKSYYEIHSSWWIPEFIVYIVALCSNLAFSHNEVFQKKVINFSTYAFLWMLYKHVYVHVYVHVYMYMYLYVCMYVCMYVCIYVYVYIYVSMYSTWIGY